MNEGIRLYNYDTSGRLVFVHFLEETEDQKDISKLTDLYQQNFILSVPESWAFFLPLSKMVISNNMGIPMPKLPQSLIINTTVFDLFQEFVIDGQVIYFAKYVIGHDHITGLVSTIVP